MTSLWGSLMLGFWLGMKHATDADHVVAVSTIVARDKKAGAAWLLGAFWGVGHTITIFAVGAAVLFLKLEIPSRLEANLEFLVGLMLIGLGAMNVAGYDFGRWGVPTHAHKHTHDDEHGHLPHAHDGHDHEHAHLHDVELPWLKRMIGAAGAFQLARSLVVGVVHGLAGSAAVALLVLSTIRDPLAGLCYLLVFGAGTLVGMLTLSALMELAMSKLSRAWAPGERALSVVTGLLSLFFGLAVCRETW
jgi:ABC-type nickel/cobalt efflux system permease component RcnA